MSQLETDQIIPLDVKIETMMAIKRLAAIPLEQPLLLLGFGTDGTLSVVKDPAEISDAPAPALKAIRGITPMSFVTTANSTITAVRIGDVALAMDRSDKSSTLTKILAPVTGLTDDALAEIKQLAGLADNLPILLLAFSGAATPTVSKGSAEFNADLSASAVQQVQRLTSGSVISATSAEDCRVEYVTIGGVTYTIIVCD